MNIGIHKLLNGTKPKNIFSFNEFTKYSENQIINTKKENSDDLFEYRKINFQRSSRIQKSYKPKKELIDSIKNIVRPQFWVAITEDWCGDSAQNLPYFAKYIEQNENIDFKIILRDENLEALDNYFTEGNPRSIPKIVAFNEDGNELFVWGPRPKFAQDLVMQLKAEGYSREEFNNELHLWYGRNRGKELEKEMLELFKLCIK